jgi:AcrR family transcriptional regulator
VSPAAPAHHFKDAKGLLTEVSAAGFREFADALEAADKAAGPDPGQRLKAQAVAYVSFAMERPARFQLMFRADKHDQTNTEFAQVAHRAYAVLEGAIRAATGTASDEPLTPESHGLLLAVWSMVHGFSHLALGGEISGPQQEPVSKQAVLESILPLLLKCLPVAHSHGPV